MRKSKAIFAGALICVFLSGFGAKEPASEAGRPLEGTPSLSVDRSFGKMPLYFIRNEGQVDSRVGHYIQGKDKTIYFTSEGLTYVLSEKRRREEELASTKRRGRSAPDGLAGEPHNRKISSAGNGRALDGTLGVEHRSSGGSIENWVVKLDFVGANRNVRPSGEDKTEAIISYFRGSPEEWKTGLSTYARVVYRELWPGIDLVYYGTVDRLKYEFIVHPGADPSQIRLAYRGASAVEVNEEGRLEVVTPAGGFEDDVPVARQEVDGKRVDVAISYELEQEVAAGASDAKNMGKSPIEPIDKEINTAGQVYGFQIGDYDRTQTLVLDPAVLVYCGYIGGSDSDYGHGIAIDGAGNACITGYTASTAATFPETVGPDLIHNGGTYDAFVAKLNSSGTALVYCGYIGGSADDVAFGIAVDSGGNAYIMGGTLSTEATFPVKTGPDLIHNGFADAFVAKVNSTGTALSYCGFIGGTDIDHGYGIAIDTAGNAYLTGYTESTEDTFPVAGGPGLTYNGGTYDAFVAKVNSSGTALSYCGYIGGLGEERGEGIAVDTAGNAYIVGYTGSNDAFFPVAGGPDLTFNGGTYDAFVAKVNSSGTALSYCGYIGGSGNDYGYGIAADSLGNAYVTGYTYSSEASFPVAVGPDLTFNGGTFDAFVAKVNSSGAALSYCGYIGGSGPESCNGIAVDNTGNAYVTGWTYSTETTFPEAEGPDLTHNGNADAFVAKVNSSGDALSYCSYIGGSGNDYGYGTAVDSARNAYVIGYAGSSEADFPVAIGPDLTYNSGTYDVFVAKVGYVKEDFLGTWDGIGVYYRNSNTGKWIKLATPVNLIAARDLGGDKIDDLITVFPSTAGVWTRSSSTGTWTKLSSTSAKHISSGDMNGDGRDDLLATWDGVGAYYRNSISGAWTKIAQPANLLAAGDLDGDSKDDPIIIFPTPAGVWVKYSKTATWAKLSSTTARDIASGDMNGDGRDDLLATWDGTGVYYRNSVSGAWVKMAQPADQVTAGDTDGDGADDLITSSAPGVYVKSSKTGTWTKLGNAARDIAAGLMRGGIWGSSAFGFIPLDMPLGGYAEDPVFLSVYKDLSEQGPYGWRFAAQEEKNLIPQVTSEDLTTPGPGDPGFVWIEQDNLFPLEQQKAIPEKRQKETSKKVKRNRAK